MRKKILALVIVIVCILQSGCSMPQDTTQYTILSTSDIPDNTTVSSLETDAGALPDALIESYYLSSEDPVYAYLQNDRIKKFFDMWLAEYFKEQVEAHWNYDTLAPVQFLNHDFDSIAGAGVEVYTCTFSIDDGRCGYIIVSYSEEGPHIKKCSLLETTPYLFDLRANSEQLAAALKEADIDLSTATAMRVEWTDTDKKRGDRIILFIDGKGNKYVCYLGDDNFAIYEQ